MNNYQNEFGVLFCQRQVMTDHEKFVFEIVGLLRRLERWRLCAGAGWSKSSAVESKHNRLLITLMTREYVSRCHEDVMCHWCCYHGFAAVWATQQRAFLPTAFQYHQITTRNYPNCEHFSSCHYISHFELETLVLFN